MWPQLLAAEGLALEEAEARVRQLTSDVHAVLGARRAPAMSAACQHTVCKPVLCSAGAPRQCKQTPDCRIPRHRDLQLCTCLHAVMWARVMR